MAVPILFQLLKHSPRVGGAIDHVTGYSAMCGGPGRKESGSPKESVDKHDRRYGSGIPLVSVIDDCSDRMRWQDCQQTGKYCFYSNSALAALSLCPELVYTRGI